MASLDHVFVMCPAGAEEAAARLEATGLRAGRSREHPGQGTANRCYWFADLMLELLWVHDAAGARTGPSAPLMLAERADWPRTGASPVGLALRPDPARPDPDVLAGGFGYAAPFLPRGRVIRVACGPPAAPLVFVSPGVSEAPDVAHPLRGSRVTRVEVRAGAWHDAPTCAALEAAGVVRGSGRPLLALGVSGLRDTVDLRPGVPLTVGPGPPGSSVGAAGIPAGRVSPRPLRYRRWRR